MINSHGANGARRGTAALPLAGLRAQIGAHVRGSGTLLSSGNLRRMAQNCRRLAASRSTLEARQTLLRMATFYDLRAGEEEALRA